MLDANLIPAGLVNTHGMRKRMVRINFPNVFFDIRVAFLHGMDLL